MIKRRYFIRYVRIILAVNTAIFSTTLHAQWREVKKAVASDRGENDQFGKSAAISGDYAIVGAPNEAEDANGSNALSFSGAAYIYKYNGNDNWIQIQKIVAADREEGDQFGYAVSISGDYAIVGAFAEDEDADGNNTFSGSGSVYIFKNDGNSNWMQIQKITASDRASDDQFGKAVSISGEHIIVGAFAEDEDADGNNTLSFSGAAYIFRNNGNDNWTQIQKITASDRSSSDQFGSVVAISGDYVIVGAATEDEDADGNNSLSASGSAYIFKNDNDNWTQLQKITAFERGINDRFGGAVTISGEFAMVGAYFEDEDADETNTLSNSGSAYIFKNDNDNWTPLQKISAADRGAGDRFGSSVSLSGDHALVGAFDEDEDADGNNTLSNSGSVYIFKNDGNDNWTQTNKIVASDRGEGDEFGGKIASIAIDDRRFIVGADREDEDEEGHNTLNNSGSAYIFQYKDAQSIDFAAIANKKYGDSFELTTTTDAGLTISYQSTDEAIATTSGNTVTVVGLGTTVITASQDGNEDYWEADQVMQNLTVDKAALLTAIADDKSKTYGEVNPALTLSYSGFVNGDDKSDLTTEPSVGTEVNESSSAGTYPITVSGGDAANYDFEYFNGSLIINKAELTATAVDYTLNEGESFPSTFDISYEGFVLSEDASVINTLPIAVPDANDTSVPGFYSISVSGGEDDNYEFTYQHGSLIVNEVLSVLKENAISVYPNPTTDLLSIGSAQVTEVEIFDLNGKLILRSGAKTIDVSGLEAATYILKLKDAEGNVLSSNRIVKH